ncbi:MAG: right-handed parallel beta-helix repeat-containing protein [Pedobacter sp.]|nr:MAG: right-handed parallel beta-helix repeat-containing protein [Pedobacter sp.]
MRLTFFLAIFLLSVKTYSRNYYVSAQTGDTNAIGLSIKQPKRTIQEAADLTRPGDTVFVMNGTYTNSCPTCNVVNITRSGSRSKPIVITNYPNHAPLISFNGWAGISIENAVSYVKVSGFKVRGNNSNVNAREAAAQGCKKEDDAYDPIFNGNGIAIVGRNGKYPHHIEISRNMVYDCGGGGISAYRADYIIFEDNFVFINSWYTVFGTSGISFYQFWNSDKKGGYHNIIRGNKCFNNRNYVRWKTNCRISDGNGIIVDDFRHEQNNSKLGRYKGKTLIENNVCWYNGGTGIHTFKSDYIDILNNTAYCNSQSPELNVGQILASMSGNINIVNNILVSDSLKVINSNYENNDIAYYNNLHYNITFPYLTASALNNASCINHLNPLFVKPYKGADADFSLQEDSPARKRGYHFRMKSLPVGSKQKSLNIGIY